MLRIKRLKWFIEKATACNLVYNESEPNGHDCWGNYEWTYIPHVRLNGKSERISDDQYIIHDGKTVHGVYYDWQLNSLIPNWRILVLERPMQSKPGAITRV